MKTSTANILTTVFILGLLTLVFSNADAQTSPTEDQKREMMEASLCTVILNEQFDKLYEHGEPSEEVSGSIMMRVLFMKMEYFEERGIDLMLVFGAPSVEEALKAFTDKAVPFYKNSLEHRDYLSGFRKHKICDKLYDES